jgi:hypothetical protein
MSDSDWTVREDSEQQRLATSMLGQLADQIVLLESVLNDGTPDVHPGSALAGDNVAIYPYSVSSIAWAPLVLAIDHLGMLSSTLRTADAIHTFAPYTLLRPAIEASAWAIWVLKPGSRDLRVERAIQFLWLDQKDSGRMSMLRGAEPVDATVLRDHLIELAARRPRIDASKLLRHVSSTEALKEADAAVDGGSQEGLLWWTMLSGLAHGRPHGFLALTQREDLMRTESGNHSLELKASLLTLAYGLRAAVRFADTAIGLFAQRNTGPRDTTPGPA